MDADDIVEPHSIARLRALADERTISYGATLVCDESLTPGEVVTSGLEGDVASDCLRGGFEVFVVSILFPRAVIDSAGPWNEDGFRVSGDWDFVLRAVEQAPVRPLAEVVSRYRRHADSITRTASIAAGAAAERRCWPAISPAIPSCADRRWSERRTCGSTSSGPATTPGRRNGGRQQLSTRALCAEAR